MIAGKTLPRIFIGSSVEGLSVAQALQENLEYDAEVTVWSQGVFEPSAATLNALLESLRAFDFALMVFSADDLLRLRNREVPTVRDNVVFELGLFYGALGQDRCFFVVPRDVVDLHLPTDLLGVTALTYSASRSDGNLIAALGTAANQVRRRIREALTSTVVFEPPPKIESPSLDDLVGMWESEPLLGARVIASKGIDIYPQDSERDALEQLFAFLETVSDAVLSGRIDEREARRHFGKAVPGVWAAAHTGLAPPNHADELWDPPPRIAELAYRWRE